MIKSARGRKINMATIVAKGEKDRAVSNVPINARGDIIDSRGEVKVTREEMSKKFYKDNLPGIEEKMSISTDGSEDISIESAAQEELITEVSRTERTRDDGTPYIEVEYSDGSMSNILSAQSNTKKKSKTKT